MLNVNRKKVSGRMQKKNAFHHPEFGESIGASGPGKKLKDPETCQLRKRFPYWHNSTTAAAEKKDEAAADYPLPRVKIINYFAGSRSGSDAVSARISR